MINKRAFSFFLIGIQLFSGSVCPVSAKEVTPTYEFERGTDLYDGLDELTNELLKIAMNDSIDALGREYLCAEELQVCEENLRENGYNAYVVNDANYEEVESLLESDFSRMGMDKDGTYLVVVENVCQDVDALANNNASEFSYSYNGTNYRLRYSYVTAAGNSGYAQSSTSNLLNSTSKTLITNCLNTAINAYISSVWAPLGTIASICGLDISKIAPNKQVTMTLNAGSNWSRVFTEVYNTYDKQWQAGSSVEYVKFKSYISGTYYDAASNSMQAVPASESSGVHYSAYYNDYTWRHQKAVLSIINGVGCKYDTTGAVKFYYGDTLKITHSENF